MSAKITAKQNLMALGSDELALKPYALSQFSALVDAALAEAEWEQMGRNCKIECVLCAEMSPPTVCENGHWYHKGNVICAGNSMRRAFDERRQKQKEKKQTCQDDTP